MSVYSVECRGGVANVGFLAGGRTQLYRVDDKSIDQRRCNCATDQHRSCATRVCIALHDRSHLRMHPNISVTITFLNINLSTFRNVLREMFITLTKLFTLPVVKQTLTDPYSSYGSIIL